MLRKVLLFSLYSKSGWLRGLKSGKIALCCTNFFYAWKWRHAISDFCSRLIICFLHLWRNFTTDNCVGDMRLDWVWGVRESIGCGRYESRLGVGDRYILWQFLRPTHNNQSKRDTILTGEHNRQKQSSGQSNSYSLWTFQWPTYPFLLPELAKPEQLEVDLFILHTLQPIFFKFLVPHLSLVLLNPFTSVRCVIATPRRRSCNTFRTNLRNRIASLITVVNCSWADLPRTPWRVAVINIGCNDASVDSHVSWIWYWASNCSSSCIKHHTQTPQADWLHFPHDLVDSVMEKKDSFITPLLSSSTDDHIWNRLRLQSVGIPSASRPFKQLPDSPVHTRASPENWKTMESMRLGNVLFWGDQPRSRYTGRKLLDCALLRCRWSSRYSVSLRRGIW